MKTRWLVGAVALSLLAAADPYRSWAQATPPSDSTNDAKDEGPEQTPLQGTGTGVAMQVELRRGTETFGSSGSSPTWEVELTVSNYDSTPATLGGSLIVLEKAKDADTTLGLYVVRATEPPLPSLRQFQLRHGLAWGVEVPVGGMTPWPWGALPGGTLGGNDLFMLVLSAPWVHGFSAGGYPAVKPRSQYTFVEKIMAPLGLRTAREALIVVAPQIHRRGATAVQTVFTFAETADGTQSGTFARAQAFDLSLAAPALEPILADTGAPLWKRVLALNLLAENAFAQSVATIEAIAADAAAPPQLRHSAILNLGVNAHTKSIPGLSDMFARASDAQLKAIILEALGEIGDASAAEIVRGGISLQDPVVRDTAIRNAAKLKDSAAAAQIAGLLAASHDEGFQRLCVSALTTISSPEAWAAVLRLLQDPKTSFQARRFAILAIGEQKYTPGESALISLLWADSESSSIKLNLIHALAAFPSDSSQAALAAAAAGEDPQVAQAAIGAIAKANTPQSQQAIITLAQRADNAQSAVAIGHLGQAKVAAAIPMLKEVLATASRRPADRRAAYLAIRSIDPLQISDSDQHALWTAFTRIRDASEAETTARALIEGGFDDGSVVPALIGGLDERKNEAWFANVLLLRHLTKQSFGPEYRFGGTKQSRQAELDKWKRWAATHAPSPAERR